MGWGRGLTCLAGGGSCSLSSFRSTSSRRDRPTVPSWDSWKLSTRAASTHLAARRRAPLRRRSAGVFCTMSV
uniref:Uncharacterized protein n=1 Tax=Ixodes ricinus TaxID=34613 RepID=A0A6B0U2V0_IXORI